VYNRVPLVDVLQRECHLQRPANDLLLRQRLPTLGQGLVKGQGKGSASMIELKHN